MPLLIVGQGSEDVPTPGVTQEVLVSSPLSQIPGKQMTAFIGRFAPGAATPLHRHPGTEFLYVLDGNGAMHIADRESLALDEGGAVLVQPLAGEGHFVHQAVNGSESAGMTTLVIVIHDTNTPPALPLSMK